METEVGIGFVARPDDWLGEVEVVFKSAMTRWSEESAALLSKFATGAGEPDAGLFAFCLAADSLGLLTL